VQVGSSFRRGVDFHVVANFVGEQVPVVGGENDRLDAVVAQGCEPPAANR
jgi:hypothetical protein